MNRNDIFEYIFGEHPNSVISECDEMFFGETLEPETIESIKERMMAFLDEDDTETHTFKSFSFDTVNGNGQRISKDAFKDQDGKTVPLKWGTDKPSEIIGPAKLEVHGDRISMSISEETYKKLMKMTKECNTNGSSINN